MIYALGSLGAPEHHIAGDHIEPRQDGGRGQLHTDQRCDLSGSSGGALINKYGQVIGITAASYMTGQNLNLAVPMSYVDTSVYGKTFIDLDQAVIADPLAYLKAYLLESGEAEM